MRTTAWVAIAAICLVACPPGSTSSEGSPPKPVGACTKEGQNCEYSPGKIGLCTAKPDGCVGGPCLSCMSLH